MPVENLKRSPKGLVEGFSATPPAWPQAGQPMWAIKIMDKGVRRRESPGARGVVGQRQWDDNDEQREKKNKFLFNIRPDRFDFSREA